MYLGFCRHSRAHVHPFLLDFIKTVGHQYVKDGCSHNFILDLLAIKAPKLFSLPEDTKNRPVAVKVQSDFSDFLQSYINQNSLKIGLLQSMNEILVCIVTCWCAVHSISFLSTERHIWTAQWISAACHYGSSKGSLHLLYKAHTHIDIRNNINHSADYPWDWWSKKWLRQLMLIYYVNVKWLLLVNAYLMWS